MLADITHPPVATLIIAGLALLVNIASSLIRKRFTDIERTRRIQREVREFNAELRKAVLSKDKEKEAKLRKKQKKMNEMQMKLMTDNMRTSMYFMLPFFGIWSLLIWLFGYESTIAYSPTPLPLLTPSFTIVLNSELNFFWWYFLSSLALSGVVTKMLGASLTD